MPVTELALLHLPPSSLPLSPSLRSTLFSAKQAMESFTSHHFHFYTQLQDPAYIYIIGTWDSLSQHQDEWIPSERNQELLRELEGRVFVEWMVHAELGGVVDEVVSLGAPVLGIERYFVSKGGRGVFESEMKEKMGVVEYIKPWRIGGGWMVERRKDAEEFVLFTGWESLEAYKRFEESEEGKEYGTIRELAEKCEVKHAVKLEL